MSRRDADPAALYRDALAHADALYALARRLAGAADADDLVQETYARALAGFAGFAAGTDLRAWLCRILRNAWIDQLRRRKVDPTDRGVELTDEVAVAPDDGELARVRGAVAAELEAALAALPPAHREVVLLDHAGLDEAELAATLGVPIGTVKSRLSRARAALRERLKDYAR